MGPWVIPALKIVGKAAVTVVCWAGPAAMNIIATKISLDMQKKAMNEMRQDSDNNQEDWISVGMQKKDVNEIKQESEETKEDC